MGKLMNVVNVSAPMRERRIKNHTQEWFDGDIAESISIRKKLLKKFKKSQLNIDHRLFKEAKYNAESLIKIKKKNFFEEKLQENVGKPKELWKTLKNLGLPNKKSSASKICLQNENGDLTFEPKSNANIFKTFFVNLASNLLSKLPIATNVFNDESTSDFYDDLNIDQNSFHLVNVSEENIFHQLAAINPNKAAGIDHLSGRFLRDGAKILALPISQICNLSIKQSKLLYKKGSCTDPKNYRPISLLPLVSKIVEKVIHQQVQEYLDKNKTLYQFQSGFRRNYSTDTCLSYLHDKILTGFDKNLITGLIAIDLQKAFDTIDHCVLLRKMKIIGFSDNVINWFRSYLSNRVFYVSVDNCLSDPGKIGCGVPQGSILGPLLFLIYINDMSQAVESELYLYADDSCILFQHKSLHDINRQLNKDFSNICDWFVDNKLSIHFGEDKTKCILFASKMKMKNIGSLDISYKNIEIKQHHHLSYLGGLLNDTMSGEEMALNAIYKINNRIKFLYRKNMYLTYNLRRLLCNSLIQPNFDYVCSTWYPTLNQKLKDKLQASQNKCIKFCLSMGQRTSLNFSHFKKIDWLPVKDRVLQCTVVHVFKYFSKKCPRYFDELFQTANSNISTRQSLLKLYQPFRKTNNGKNTISYLGPKIWNALPDLVKQCKSLNSFKHKLKSYYFEQLETKENNVFSFY